MPLLPGTAMPMTRPSGKVKTMSQVLPRFLPSVTLTTYLHFNSLYDVSMRPPCGTFRQKTRPLPVYAAAGGCVHRPENTDKTEAFARKNGAELFEEGNTEGKTPVCILPRAAQFGETRGTKPGARIQARRRQRPAPLLFCASLFLIIHLHNSTFYILHLRFAPFLPLSV